MYSACLIINTWHSQIDRLQSKSVLLCSTILNCLGYMAPLVHLVGVGERGHSWNRHHFFDTFFWQIFDIEKSFMGFSTLFLTAWPCQILVSTIFWYHNVKRSVRWISARTSSNIYNSFCFYIVLKKINIWTNLRFVALWSWWNSLHLWGYFRKSTRQFGSSKSSEKKIFSACFGSAIGGSESRVSEMNFGKLINVNPCESFRIVASRAGFSM